MYIGFSIGGVEWLASDLEGAADDLERADRLRHIGFEEARLTHAMGGNLLRIFYTMGHLYGPLGDGRAFDLSGLPVPYERPWYLLPESRKVEVCDQVLEFLTVARTRVTGDGSEEPDLRFWDLDAYLEGVQSFAGEAGEQSPVDVLLTNVVLPPVPILEAPNDAVLAAHGRSYRFRDLWAAYCDLHVRMARVLTHRYVVAPGPRRIVCAFEVSNEPDYEWLPDENRIEKSARPEANPLGKYITELHNAQIPNSAALATAHEPTAWGGFRDQEGPWRDLPPRLATPVLEFDWGEKFDWYVARYAEYAEHLSYAFWTTSREAGVKTHIISGAVTHNNLDYLVRMYRANPNAFGYCTSIGLHPYHWPRHDIYDTTFRRERQPADWVSSTPRTFASEHFKCFDFFTEIARIMAHPPDASFGMGGKSIWLTEFGLATKMLGTYNETSWEFVPFIRPRGTPADALPRASVVWEDLWDAFLDQVSPDFLSAHRVEALCFYTLRETAGPGLDKHDDDRANLSLLRRSGLPRLDPGTFERVVDFISHATGTPRRATSLAFPPMPAWARKKVFSTRLLHSAPWRAIPVPSQVAGCLSMLSPDEKQLLYWAASEYYRGDGAIIDAGCFAGGSTVALAGGLAAVADEASRNDRGRHVDSFDRFITDEYMRVWYFEQNGLKTEGDRFRNIFDDNIAPFADFVRVFDGDVMDSSWESRPVEILFLDICKAWDVNDYCTRRFFPLLIPGQSLVIQQDFFHHLEYWVILTQELLHEHFDYIGPVRWNTAVFRSRTAVDPAAIPARLRDLGFTELDLLFERHIARYDAPYERDMLACARAFFHLEFGELDLPRQVFAEVKARQEGAYEFAQTLDHFSAELARRC